jgi:hypothetical protein
MHVQNLTDFVKFETIKRMQAYYRSVLGQDAPASPAERLALRRAMVDYGALQPSPVQKPAESSHAPDAAGDEVCCSHPSRSPKLTSVSQKLPIRTLQPTA